MTYTAGDFKNATFARRSPDEYCSTFAVRDRDDPDAPWRGKYGAWSDAQMAGAGFVPVQESRPLTPDDITDEMVKRAAHCLAMDDSPSLYSAHPDGTAAKFRALALETLLAAVTEPPARPEGAEELGDLLRQADLDGVRDQAGIESVADFLASNGVRVVGGEADIWEEGVAAGINSATFYSVPRNPYRVHQIEKEQS